jgi:serine/threonine protein kinase
VKRLALLEPGARVDRYVVLDTLGQGGMAVVYRVRHEQLGSTHALKVVVVPSRSIMTRLLAEGKAQARLRHRNVVLVNDVIEVDGSPGLVMEYVPGPSLEKLLRNVPLDLETIDRLGRQILRGIGAAHDAGLVHRDLKPANILCSFEEDGLIPKIADFGLVKDQGAASGDTRTGSVMGTPNYMSPEQIRDTKSVDHRTDLFAIGAILYEMLTRTLAFPGEDMLEIFNRVADGRFDPVRDRRPDAPDRMVQTIERALRVKRDERAASAAEMLETWCADVPDAALPQISLPEASIEWIRSETLVPPDHTPPPISSRGGTVSVEDEPVRRTTGGRNPRSTVSAVDAPASRSWWPLVLLGVGGVGLVGVAVCAGLGGAGVAVGGWFGSPVEVEPVDGGDVVTLPEPPPPDPVPVSTPEVPGPVDPPVPPAGPPAPRPRSPWPAAPGPRPHADPDPRAARPGARARPRTRPRAGPAHRGRGDGVRHQELVPRRRRRGRAPAGPRHPARPLHAARRLREGGGQGPRARCRGRPDHARHVQGRAGSLLPREVSGRAPTPRRGARAGTR